MVKIQNSEMKVNLTSTVLAYIVLIFQVNIILLLSYIKHINYLGFHFY